MSGSGLFRSLKPKSGLTDARENDPMRMARKLERRGGRWRCSELEKMSWKRRGRRVRSHVDNDTGIGSSLGNQNTSVGESESVGSVCE